MAIRSNNSSKNLLSPSLRPARASSDGSDSRRNSSQGRPPSMSPFSGVGAAEEDTTIIYDTDDSVVGRYPGPGNERSSPESYSLGPTQNLPELQAQTRPGTPVLVPQVFPSNAAREEALLGTVSLYQEMLRVLQAHMHAVEVRHLEEASLEQQVELRLMWDHMQAQRVDVQNKIQLLFESSRPSPNERYVSMVQEHSRLMCEQAALVRQHDKRVEEHAALVRGYSSVV